MATQIVINDPITQRHVAAPAIAVVSSDANNALRTGSDGNLFVQGSGGGSGAGGISSESGNYLRPGRTDGLPYVGGEDILSNDVANVLHLDTSDRRRIVLTAADINAAIGGGSGTIQADVTQLKSDMTVVKTDITNLRNDVNTNTRDIADLKQDMRDITVVSKDRYNVITEGSDKGAYLSDQDVVNIVKNAGITKVDVRDLINTGDPLLAVRNDKIVSDLSLQYNSANGRVDILGVHGNSIASAIIPTAVTMLQNVSLVDNPIGQPAGTYIHFVFRLQDGSTTDMYLNVSRLAQFYTAGDGISITSAGVVSVNATRIEEIVTDGIEAKNINLVSTNANNLLVTGTDGRAYLDPSSLPSGISADVGNGLRLGSDNRPYSPLDYGTL